MKDLDTYVIESTLKDIYSDKLLSDIKKSLLCWSATGISSYLMLFENSKYSFDNCDAVIDDVLDIINSNPKSETITLDCVKHKTFFKKLIIKLEHGQKITGYHEERKMNDGEVSFGLVLLKKDIEEYTLNEIRRVKYIIIHELTHAYENYLLVNSGNPNGIFYDIDSKEYKKYHTSVAWLLTNRKMPKLKEELILCGYFLDDHEKFAYLGTVKETVKNIFHKIKPTYKDLKFDELLDLFKEEFIWEKYLQIHVFIETLKKQKSDSDLLYKVNRLYNSIYDDNITEDEIINELSTKWDLFQKEFIEEFIEAYSSCEDTIKLEAFIDMQF